VIFVQEDEDEAPDFIDDSRYLEIRPQNGLDLDKYLPNELDAIDLGAFISVDEDIESGVTQPVPVTDGKRL
jgi:hypothetical protein